MLAKIHVAVLLVDDDLADQAESLLSADVISLEDAAVAWG